MSTKTTLVADRKIIWQFTPVTGWGVFVLWMSLMPSRDLPDPLLDMSDFFLHSMIYVVWMHLTFIGYWFRRQGASIKSVFIAWICAMVFGLMVEFAQKTFTDSRQFDPVDLAANALGGLVGAFLIYRILKKRSAIG